MQYYPACQRHWPQLPEVHNLDLLSAKAYEVAELRSSSLLDPMALLWFVYSTRAG